MKKYIIVIILFLFQFSCNQKKENDNFSKYYSDYIPSSTENQVLHNSYFSYSYLKEHELSEWTVYLSTKYNLENKQYKRKDTFKKDPKLPSSISGEDYYRTGYDRGHLVPASDMQFDSLAMLEAFYYTNTAPQTPQLNRGIWRKLESAVRDWTIEYDSLIIISGCVLKDEKNFKLPKIGKVSVPSFYYKVIIDKERMSSIAFAIPNYPEEHDLISYAISIKELEKITGVDFFYKLNDSTELILESEKNISTVNKKQDKNIDTKLNIKDTIPLLNSKKRSAVLKKKVIENLNIKKQSNFTNFSFSTIFRKSEPIYNKGVKFNILNGYYEPFDSTKDILFSDIDNPLKLETVNVDGYNFNDFKIMISNQEIFEKEVYDSSCYILVNPSNFILEGNNGLNIKIFLENELLSEKYFKIIKFPYFQLAIDEFIVPKNGVIKMTKESLIKSKKLFFDYGNYYPFTSKGDSYLSGNKLKGNKYLLTSFTVTGMYKGEQLKVENSAIRFDSDEIKNIFRNTRTGNSITLTNIKAVRIKYDSFATAKENYDNKILFNSKLNEMEKVIQVDPIVIEVVRSY